MKRFKRALAVWIWGLLGGALGGGFSAVITKFGLDGLNALGATVPTFSPKQMLWMFAGGMLSHGYFYVRKSPMPDLQFDETTPPIPLADGSNVKPQNKTE